MPSNENLDALIEQRGILKGLNPTLGITAITMIVFFMLYAILLGKTASEQFLGLKTWIESTLGWYYVLMMFLAFLVCMYITCSRVGKIRLGRDDHRPEFSNFSWFSMLFGCGTGAVSVTLWTARSPEERISRGRTIRELMLGVMFIPPVVALAWACWVRRASMKRSTAPT